MWNAECGTKASEREIWSSGFGVSGPHHLPHSALRIPHSVGPGGPSLEIYLKKLRFIAIYDWYSSGTSSSGKMAFTGHSGSHAPQSIHSSGSIKSCSAASKPGSSFRG